MSEARLPAFKPSDLPPCVIEQSDRKLRGSFEKNYFSYTALRAPARNAGGM